MTATSTRKRRSIFNVIPFGDNTEEEIMRSAAANKVTTAEAYSANQEPIEELERTYERVNPAGLLPGVSNKYWVPIGALSIAIQPMADAAMQAATANTLKQMRDALANMLETLKRNAAAITPPVWAEMEKKRIQNYIRTKNASGKTPDPKMIVPKELVKNLHLTSAYWKPVNDMIEWLKDPVNKEPPFTIFTEGSIKLPFYQWSTVPGITCPGAGKCWDERPAAIKIDKNGDPYRNISSTPHKAYCYSLSGWRQVYPYLRQLQNTILTRISDKSHIERDLMRVQKRNPKAVVRLFVDGDFDSLETLEFWMHTCRRFPEMQFYGYSKSWHIFVKYDEKHGGNWPENYVLNLSNGTMWETLGGEIYRKMSDRMLQLKCVRGRFIAIKDVYRRDAQGKVIMQEVTRNNKKFMEPIQSVMPKISEKLAKDEADPRYHESIATQWKQHMQDVIWKARDEGLENVFPCPGKCYACLGKKIGTADWKAVVEKGGYGKHACGELNVRKHIVIAVH